MAEFRKMIDSLPFIVRVLLALPAIDGIVYGIYRICRGDLPNVILGVIWIFAGTVLTWILDLIFLFTKGYVFEMNK